MTDDRFYLIDIAERIQRIELYTLGGRVLFLQSPMIQDAVIRNFELIGEGVKRVSQELRHKSFRCSLAADSWISGCIDSRLFGCGSR